MDDNKSIFEMVGQSPHAWLSSATQLKKAADLVAAELRKIMSVYPFGRAKYQDLVLFNSYMLLAGLSLENLTKGILIGRNPALVGPDFFDLTGLTKGKRSSHGHDLFNYLQEVDNSSKEELELAKRLSEFVVWAGKYPINLKAEKTISPSFRATDIDDVDTLFLRLADVLGKENSTSTIEFAS